MKYPKPVWDQLRYKTIQEIQSALERDGWEPISTKGGTIPYVKEGREPVVLHIHPKKNDGTKTTKTDLYANWMESKRFGKTEID